MFSVKIVERAGVGENLRNLAAHSRHLPLQVCPNLSKEPEADAQHAAQDAGHQAPAPMPCNSQFTSRGTSVAFCVQHTYRAIPPKAIR